MDRLREACELTANWEGWKRAEVRTEADDRLITLNELGSSSGRVSAMDDTASSAGQTTFSRSGYHYSSQRPVSASRHTSPEPELPLDDGDAGHHVLPGQAGGGGGGGSSIRRHDSGNSSSHWATTASGPPSASIGGSGLSPFPDLSAFFSKQSPVLQNGHTSSSNAAASSSGVNRVGSPFGASPGSPFGASALARSAFQQSQHHQQQQQQQGAAANSFYHLVMPARTPTAYTSTGQSQQQGPYGTLMDPSTSALAYSASTSNGGVPPGAMMHPGGDLFGTNNQQADVEQDEVDDGDDQDDDDDEEEEGDDSDDDDDGDEDAVVEDEDDDDDDDLGDASDYSATANVANAKRKRKRRGGKGGRAGASGGGGSGSSSAAHGALKKVRQHEGSPATSSNAGSARKGKNKAGAGGAGHSANQAVGAGDDAKPKSTRGSKACTVCRRLKMRCEPTGNPKDTKCKRCKSGGHECVFEESQRGRRKNQKTDAMVRSIKNMESTLEMVLKSVASGNTATLAGMKVGDDGLLVPAEKPEEGLSIMLPPKPPKNKRNSSVTAAATANGIANSNASSSSSSGTPSSQHAPSMMPPPASISTPFQPQPPSLPSGPQILAGGFSPTNTAGRALAPTMSGNGSNNLGLSVSGPNSSHRPSNSTSNITSPFTAFTNAQDTPASTGSDTSRMQVLKAEDNNNASPALRLPSLPEPENTWAPLGLLAEASLENTQRKERRSTIEPGAVRPVINEEPGARNPDVGKLGGNGKLGVANDAYFQPGPFNILPLRQLMIDKNLPSPLLTEKIISVEEAVMLFNIFHQECTMFLAHMINSDIHTPTTCSLRSTFLFTTICAVASKFYRQRPELYGLCMPRARKLASEMIERGFKSVEIVQAYTLLAYYNAPTERFEDDRTYTYSGLAIRMAVELNLWRNPKLPPDLDEEGVATFRAETMNRERTWLQVFMLDRSQALQTGRPHVLKVGHLERNARRWAGQSDSRATDAGQAAIVELYTITSGFSDLLRMPCLSEVNHRAGFDLEQRLQDYAIIFRAVENALDGWNSDWVGVLPGTPANPVSHRQGTFSEAMGRYYYNVHRLLAFSFALQQVLKMNPSSSLDILPYFLPCYQSASLVLTMAAELHKLGHLTYAPDHIFINVSYAAVFLLKLLRPELADLTNTEAILKQVEDVVNTFADCALDEVHTPNLYAGFLRVLLQSKQSRDADPSRSRGEGNVDLDPALANKLMQHQNGGTVPVTGGPGPSGGSNVMGGGHTGHNGSSSMSAQPTIFVNQMVPEQVAQQYPMAHHVTFADGLDNQYDPSPSLFGTASWNLDQLGQTGFWEHLSMPGLGSPPAYGLSAGHLVQGDAWPFSVPNSAAPSRNASPKLGPTMADFGVGSMGSL